MIESATNYENWMLISDVGEARNHEDGRENINVNEEVKYAVALLLENFIHDDNQYEYTFPSSFISTERAFVNKLARSIGLKSKTTKTGMYRNLTVYKPTLVILSKKPYNLSLTWNSRRAISQLLHINCLTLRERMELQPRMNKNISVDRTTKEERLRGTTGKLMGAVPQVPIKANSEKHLSPEVEERMNDIITAVTKYQIIMITGSAGIPLTTEIPQMIMNDCCEKSQRCRMICSQNHRLSAHASAERVAQSRNEIVGQTVGYQIRLESKVSPRTLLTFCTNGVLLRTLYAESSFLQGTTHIIIDDLHERDFQAEFLLMVLKQALNANRHLRLILLLTTNSVRPYATGSDGDGRGYGPADIMDPCVKQLCQYFNNCPIINVVKAHYRVMDFFLEDILHGLGFFSENMKKIKVKEIEEKEQAAVVGAWIEVLYELYLNFASKKSFPPEKSSTEFDEINWSQINNRLDTSQRDSFTSLNHIKANLSEEELRSMEIHGVALQMYDPCLAIEVDKLLWDIWCLPLPVITQDLLDMYSTTIGIEIDPISMMLFENNKVKKLLTLIANHNVPVDYAHSLSGMTPLIVCSARGIILAVDCLLKMGADPCLTSTVIHANLLPWVFLGNEQFSLFPHASIQSDIIKNTKKLFPTSKSTISGPPEAVSKPIYESMNALAWTNYFHHHNCAELIRFHALSNNVDIKSDVPIVNETMSVSSRQMDDIAKMERLSYFLKSLPHENHLDMFFMKELIEFIERRLPGESILVFLPSYDDLINLKEYLNEDYTKQNQSVSRRVVYLLHSRILVADLKHVYEPAPNGCHKIVLASSIGEKSTHVPNVSVVIDSGKERRKCFNHEKSSLAFETPWISHDRCLQRKLLAGIAKEGFCYRLYTKSCHSSMDKHRVSNIKYSPLEELCLQARLLAPSNTTVVDYLQQMLDPPPLCSLTRSLSVLKEIGALDKFEELTELGYHLCDLPIDPRYGKMVLCSVALKCLDPILTIACILSYKEPFGQPRHSFAQRDLIKARKKFAADTCSDHMVLLRAFQFWQKARAEGWEKNFCFKNHISSADFEIITGIRTQLLGQLRASGFVKARGSGDIRDLNANSENWAVVKAALVGGMYGNLAQFHQENMCLTSALHKKLIFHPSSVLVEAGIQHPYSLAVSLENLPCDWLIYDNAMNLELSPKAMEEIPSKSKYHFGDVAVLKCITLISPVAVALMSGQLRLTSDMLKDTETIFSGSPYYNAGQNVYVGGSNPTLPNPESSNYGLSLAINKEKEGSKTSENVDHHSDVSEGSSEDAELNPQSNSTPIRAGNNESVTGSPTLQNSFYSDNDANTGILHNNHQKTTETYTFVNNTSTSAGNPPKSSSNNKVKKSILKLDDGLVRFKMENELMQLLLMLKMKWQLLFLRRLRYPGRQCLAQDEAVLRTLVLVLTSEEQTIGLKQPSGVGTRPRPMATELCNTKDTSDNEASSRCLSMSMSDHHMPLTYDRVLEQELSTATQLQMLNITKQDDAVLSYDHFQNQMEPKHNYNPKIIIANAKSEQVYSLNAGIFPACASSAMPYAIPNNSTTATFLNKASNMKMHSTDICSNDENHLLLERECKLPQSNCCMFAAGNSARLCPDSVYSIPMNSNYLWAAPNLLNQYNNGNVKGDLANTNSSPH